jgi:hypothetical protein
MAAAADELHGAIGAGGESRRRGARRGRGSEVEQRAEALHEGDGTRVWVGDAVGACSLPLPGKLLGQEHTEGLAQKLSVAGRAETALDAATTIPTVDRGTRGSTRSTRSAVVCAIRRLVHEGQNPRVLHENATNRSSAHVSQRTRTNPWHSKPQARNFSNSRSTNGRARCRAALRDGPARRRRARCPQAGGGNSHLLQRRPK